MYRVKILTLMVFSVVLAVAAFQFFELPTEPDFYSRALSKFIAGLEREYGKTAVSGSIFAVGIFSFMVLKRRT